MRARRVAVVGEPGLGVDRAPALRRDRMESPDARRRRDDGCTERIWAEPVGLRVDLHVRRSGTARRRLARLHDGAGRRDRDVAEVAIVSARDRLHRPERADGAQSRHRGAARQHRTVLIPDDPHLAGVGRDGRLVLLDRRRPKLRQGGEGRAAVGAHERHDELDRVVQIRDEEIAERVPR